VHRGVRPHLKDVLASDTHHRFASDVHQVRAGGSALSLRDAINQLLTDAKDIAQLVAPIAAVLGFLGLGVMYLGSSWPIIGDWRRDNPKAANQVVMGLLFIIAASSVTTIISFS
jgi:hypothetical protein